MMGDFKRWVIFIVIASEAKQSHKKVEIATLPSVTRNDDLLYEIATLPSVTRNDDLLYEIASPLRGSQ